MGKYLSVIGGITAIVLGVAGLINWWEEYVMGFLLSGLVIMLILGGILALFAGVGEIRDSAAEKKENKQQ